MSEFSDYFENAIINQMRNVAGPQAAVYVALFDDNASVGELEAGTLTNEISGGSYARELAGLSAAAGGVSSNAADIEFTTATATWGLVSYVALMDAISAGNILMFSALDTAKQVDSGDTFKINAGDLDVTVT
jgi:hypothetical protein